MSHSVRVCALLLALSAIASAQSIFGTLSGIVSDPSGAVIAGAQVKLRNQQSGSTRETVSNTEGVFTFVSLPPAIYELNVVAAGFETYKARDIELGGGDRLNSNVMLKVGNTSNVVEVSAVSDVLAPVDSGEKADKLGTRELENFIQVGSNAAEFLKIMPGFAIQNGTNNVAGYDGQTMGINGNGNSGNQSPLNGAYSYNGLPGNSLDITADGAHVSDPGCNCATPVNPNSAMISEIKISMSNFSAENQKGPGVVSSVAKGGGREFHGSLFTDVRHYALNANDWLSNYSNVARPNNKYIYPGGTLGGPVVIPGTNFNRNRDKLFFFTGYQYFYQVLDTGLLRATVPTAGMREGNFTTDELSKLGRITASGAAPNQLNARALTLYPDRMIPKNEIDPNMQTLMKLYPMPNADPNSNGGYNWVDNLLFNQNNMQWMTRVDYSVSENTKMFVRYNLQKETQLFPIGLWSSTKTQQVPYPTPIEGKNASHSITASMTHVFNSTMTNETVFGYTYITFPNSFQDPSKVDRSKMGFNYKGLFKNGVAQFPNITSNGELSGIGTNGGFEVGGSRGLYADKFMPSFSDTFAKLYRKHTIKAGFFWENIRNSQPASSNTQGVFTFNVSNPNSLGSQWADMLTGTLNSYQETSFNRINDISYMTAEGFIQDSFKVSKRLTIEAGIRITHFEPWKDNEGFGFSVFDYSKYSPTCRPLDYCGFLWNKRDPSVPLGGFPTATAYYQPRFGMALDLFGNGKTVLRGGWGRYYYHSAQFTTGLNVSAGMQTLTLSNNQGLNNGPLRARDLDGLPFSTQALSTGAVQRDDTKSPLTDSYSFTISQRIPFSSLFEIAYVGNQSRDLLNTAGGAGGNINLVPPGSMLASRNNGVDPSTLNANNFRPLQGFADLSLATHNLYSNYNSLQLKWLRTRGRTVISANYTFGKSLGILSPTLDSFNLANDYGVQPGNRKHIFNIAYSHDFGRVVRHRLGGAFLNSWQVSGVVQVQSGANLTGNRGQNFSMALNALKVNGTNQNVSAASILGTPNITLMPIVTCDPRENLREHQFINNQCFAAPRNVGEYTNTTLPAIYGPAYFNTDLGVFKNFSLSEKKKLQFRFNGYNFLNHPLWSFYNNGNLTLGFNGTTGAMNTPLFGEVNVKQGRRTIQLAVKFFF
jgi:hypothetical protein